MNQNPSSTDGRTRSVWQQSGTAPSFAALSRNENADVCVIGAGIAGLTTAYLLLQAGKSVIVLDDSPVGDGQTGRTSAHLASALDDRFHAVSSMHGDEVCRLAYQSHASAIDLIEGICREQNIDAEFARLDGYLFLEPEDDTNELKDELAAAQAAGASVEWVDHAPLRGVTTGPALRFARQGRFHPQKYLAGLARAVERQGGWIFTSTHVNDAQGADAAKDEPAKVTTSNGYTVTCQHVVVATNTPTPINDWAGIYTKQASYRTYCIAAKVPPGSVVDALYWDTIDPYHYVRVTGGDTLIVGGQDHKTGHQPASDPFVALEQWTRQHFPQAGEISQRWSGQVQEPVDGLAYIGLSPHSRENVFVITGDSGMGLTHGSIGGAIVCDLILGRENPFAAIYNPRRKPLSAPGEYLRENLDAAATMTAYLTPGELASEEEIPAGEGAIIRQGLKKLAVYKDDGGQLHRLSSVCPHLGCIVNWNSIEKTWDCPCHGSRFECKGNVIMGPATEGLKALE